MLGIAGQAKHGKGRSNFRGNHQKDQENKTCVHRMKEGDLFNMAKRLTWEIFSLKILKVFCKGEANKQFSYTLEIGQGLRSLNWGKEN